jgi:hypothetical protein
MLLNFCEFRENWRSEGYNFLVAVNETPLTAVPCNCTIFWEQIVSAGSRTSPFAILLRRDKVRHLDAVRYLFLANKQKQETRRRLMSICNTKRPVFDSKVFYIDNMRRCFVCPELCNWYTSVYWQITVALRWVQVWDFQYFWDRYS